VAANLVEGLSRLGHEAELQPMQARRSEGMVNVGGVPARLRQAARINRYIHRQRFDVVHIHWAYMGWLGISGRYPYFLHCHGSDLRRNLRWPILAWLTRRALGSARRVFYSTPDLRGYAKRVRPDSVFAPNPVNLRLFQPADAEVGRNGGARILLTSRFDAVKGVGTAVTMVRNLKRRSPLVEVDAFNWGSLTSSFADPRLINRIEKVPYHDVPDLLSRYDIVIGQFKLGAVGMSELEAMACGKPVVAYFNYPNVYDEPPPIFSTRDPREGAEVLQRLVEDEGLRREAGEKGRAWVEKNHDHLKVARLMESHYREVLGG